MNNDVDLNHTINKFYRALYPARAEQTFSTNIPRIFKNIVVHILVNKIGVHTFK